MTALFGSRRTSPSEAPELLKLLELTGGDGDGGGGDELSRDSFADVGAGGGGMRRDWVASPAQNLHPSPVTEPSDDHEMVALVRGTASGPLEPLYSTPLTASLSQHDSVLKATALRDMPTCAVMVQRSLLP